MGPAPWRGHGCLDGTEFLKLVATALFHQAQPPSPRRKRMMGEEVHGGTPRTALVHSKLSVASGGPTRRSGIGRELLRALGGAAKAR